MLIFIVAISSGLAWLLGSGMRPMIRNAFAAFHEPGAGMSQAAGLTSEDKPVGPSEPVTSIMNEPKSRAARGKSTSRPVRIIVAMTGATGAVLGIRILEILRDMGVETHLIVSRWAAETLRYEGNYSIKDVKALATFCYAHNDAGALPSSGSFQTDGMIVVPCSMRTLSAIRTGFADDLICRAADVTIKEHRKLVLVARETPLSPIHLANMLALAQMQDVIIFPPVPAFYTRPKSLSDIVDQSVGRMIDMLGLESDHFPRWNGMDPSKA
ncbi:hypothetical protein PV08_08544 [Exophiala spinifera]|uniref:Flavin prenyltransferase PAD1, mitochondrial n=1 Tax=Exophiala spinifera TaxID=91928 RepID=A0A0D1YE36_9EURO|nr:uncharacterized protein PV08_08544 [Exophiala spinifera]KIW13356.1 hypothetical protein PV08_08544 [Exophiala spinifera]